MTRIGFLLICLLFNINHNIQKLANEKSNFENQVSLSRARLLIISIDLIVTLKNKKGGTNSRFFIFCFCFDYYFFKSK
ncbi:hypothetical protein A9G22_03675 [Gilliamella sp. App2-1]|nr:hypothetical protein A9G22_03675 [Gilliamella apicola]